jgi:hypothetical protein
VSLSPALTGSWGSLEKIDVLRHMWVNGVLQKVKLFMVGSRPLEPAQPLVLRLDTARPVVRAKIVDPPALSSHAPHCVILGRGKGRVMRL